MAERWKKERGKASGRRNTREEYAGGPNPPAARSYRSYKNFSRNNLQRLENRLIDCLTHDFACKEPLCDAFSRKRQNSHSCNVFVSSSLSTVISPTRESSIAG